MSDVNRESLTKRVLNFIHQNPGSKPSDIANCLGISRALVYKILGYLKSKGLIKKLGQGYVVTDRGAELVQKGKGSTRVFKNQSRVLEELDMHRVSVRSTDVAELREEVELMRRELEEIEEKLRMVGNAVGEILELIAKLPRAIPSESERTSSVLQGLVERAKIVDRDLALALLSEIDRAGEVCKDFVVIENVVVHRSYLRELLESEIEALTSIERAIVEKFRYSGAVDLCRLVFY